MKHEEFADEAQSKDRPIVNDEAMLLTEAPHESTPTRGRPGENRRPDQILEQEFRPPGLHLKRKDPQASL